MLTLKRLYHFLLYAVQRMPWWGFPDYLITQRDLVKMWESSFKEYLHKYKVGRDLAVKEKEDPAGSGGSLKL